MRYSRGKFGSAEDVILAAHAGDDAARAALTEYAEQLAAGIASIVRLLDPAVIVLAGGLSANNDLLFASKRAASVPTAFWKPTAVEDCGLRPWATTEQFTALASGLGRS